MDLIDTHAHLDFKQFNKDRDQVIERARECGVKCIVNIGTRLASSRKSLELSQKYDDIYSTVGIHPHNADEVGPEKAVRVLKDLAKADKVKAIGEIGLDFHYDNSPREKQKKMFRRLMELSIEIGLPPVIHSREAEEETMDILRDYDISKTGGIMHCFAGDHKMAEELRKRGYYFSVNGIISFGSAKILRQTIKEIPIERLLLETDCPFLAPEPYRGKTNQPSYVKKVAEKLAEIKDIPLKQVATKTTENARQVFNLTG